MSDSNHGSFVWYEMMATDASEAVDFYTKLIGWTTQEWNDLGQPYTMWIAGESPFAGLMELPEDALAAGAPPHWLGYVAVGDVDKVTSRAIELGARVLVAPQDIPTVGRFSVIVDPQGAVISPFNSTTENDGDCEPMAMLKFSWHELATSNLEAAWSFYSELFGWRIIDDMDMGPAGTYRMYGFEGRPPLGGIYTKAEDVPGPPAWLFYIMVENVSALVERVATLGGTVLNGPMEVPGGGSIAQCLDSQGTPFALYSEAQK